MACWVMLSHSTTKCQQNHKWHYVLHDSHDSCIQWRCDAHQWYGWCHMTYKEGICIEFACLTSWYIFLWKQMFYHTKWVHNVTYTWRHWQHHIIHIQDSLCQWLIYYTLFWMPKCLVGTHWCTPNFQWYKTLFTLYPFDCIMKCCPWN